MLEASQLVTTSQKRAQSEKTPESTVILKANSPKRVKATYEGYVAVILLCSVGQQGNSLQRVLAIARFHFSDSFK